MIQHDRVAVVQGNLESLLETIEPAASLLPDDSPVRRSESLTVAGARALFEDQVTSRLLDVAARELKKTGRSFYTISSAGHEQNVVLGKLLRTTDPSFLHYRSGALMVARLRTSPECDPIREILLSLAAKAEDPVCRGRHKVWGSRELWVPPQTSTIASHLPKAVGCSFALARARKLGVENGLPRDAIVCCSFGDASVNHATALAGINAARYAARQGHPAPILFVCEDNGRGISVETPLGWISSLFDEQPFLGYVRAFGDLGDVWSAAERAIRECRSKRIPVLLHVDCVRLWGHAGSDVESTYLTLDEIERTESKDPLLSNARWLVESGVAAPGALRTFITETSARIAEVADEISSLPHLDDRETVIAPIAPYDAGRTETATSISTDDEVRSRIFAGELPERSSGVMRRTMAAHINSALTDEMIRHEEIVVFGEDVGKKGGVYFVTQGLQKRFGRARVFDTLLDETTILGIAQGAAQVGLLPIAEIQYLAYVHNAIDQLRGEACSLSFFSDRQFVNPMVVRIASFAYQKGFGGHFHNDNAIGALRDIPGLVLCTPSRGDDAARLLRGAVAVAKQNDRVVCFLEPIALYHEKDLHDDGDRGWLFDYPSVTEAILPGDVGVYHEDASDVLIASYANGVRLSLRAAQRLERDRGIRARVLDLRWLNPLPLEAFSRHATECARVLVVDECRATGGGIADPLVAHLAESDIGTPVRTLRAADSYVPLGPSADAVLVSEDQIVESALKSP